MMASGDATEMGSSRVGANVARARKVLEIAVLIEQPLT